MWRVPELKPTNTNFINQIIVCIILKHKAQVKHQSFLKNVRTDSAKHFRTSRLHKVRKLKLFSMQVKQMKGKFNQNAFNLRVRTYYSESVDIFVTSINTNSIKRLHNTLINQNLWMFRFRLKVYIISIQNPVKHSQYNYYLKKDLVFALRVTLNKY